ncbi:MAG: GNAT family N-acetyltransferase [Chloroflexi bacterium]|nr:GNAT family N-acetyltransferase [Chloroflexota bacterium]
MATLYDRPFAGEADIEAITQFLLETYVLHGWLLNWDPRRWHGQVYHNNNADFAAYRARLPEEVHIWQTAEGAIRGVVIPERPGSVFVQIHPAARHIEAAMLAWSEAHLAQVDADGTRWIGVWADEPDTHRNDLLGARGYIRSEAHDTMRRRPMSDPVPDLPVPQGYRVRSMGRAAADRESYAAMLNAAFGRSFHSAEEYGNFQTSPLYREALDIVVEAPDGSLAATAGFTAHERESFALLEPVCTHPEHQGRGLAGAAIAEGLRRVQALGIGSAFVGAWHANPVSNHLYQKMGFRDGVRQYLWRRIW